MTYIIKKEEKKNAGPSFLQSALQSIKEPDGHFRAECRVTNMCNVLQRVGKEVARI